MNAKNINGTKFKIPFQKTRNTSLPNKETERNIKNNNIIRNLQSVYSVLSSGFPEFGPPD